MSNIAGSLRRPLAYSIASSYSALLLNLVSTMIISRLLTPAEIGVFAVAAVFASLASTFRDFGVAEYLIQKKELKDEHIRASLTVNTGISWTMGFLLFFSAPFAAEFYSSPGVGDVMRVQAFNFALIPIGAVTMAYFRRQLDFRPIFIANLLANITIFFVSVTCAFNGLSYMSLAWSSFSGVVVSVAVSLHFRPAGFPKWPGFSEISEVVHFGKFASSIYIFGQLGAGAPEMIIGRFHNLSNVALFSRACGIAEIFDQTIMRATLPVCLPYFSKNHREHGTILRGYLSSVSYLTAIGWPFFASAGAMSYSVIRIIYGNQWIEAAPLTKFLCLSASISLIHRLAREALIAVQQVKRSSTLQLSIQCVRIFGIFLVIPYGLIGACYGLIIASIFSFFLSQWHLKRAIGLSYRDVLSACSASGLMTLFSAGPIILWVLFFPMNEVNYLVSGIFRGCVFFLLWILSLRLFKHPLWTELASRVARFSYRP